MSTGNSSSHSFTHHPIFHTEPSHPWIIVISLYRVILQQPPHPRHTDRLRMCTTCTVVHWLDPFRFCSKLEQFTIPGGRRVTQFQNTIRIDAKQLAQVPIDSTTTLPAIRTGGRYTGWSCSEVTVRGPPHRFAVSDGEGEKTRAVSR